MNTANHGIGIEDETVSQSLTKGKVGQLCALAKLNHIILRDVETMTKLRQCTSVELPTDGATQRLLRMSTEDAGTYQNRSLLNTLLPLTIVGRRTPRSKPTPDSTIVLGVYVVEDQTEVFSTYILM